MHSFSHPLAVFPVAILATSLLTLSACGDDDAADGTGGSSAGGSTGATGNTGGAAGGAGGSDGGTGGLILSDSYELESKFVPGESAISYSGQTFRHALIESLDAYIESMTTAIDADTFNPTETSTVIAALNYYYDFDDATSDMDPHLVATDPAALQETWADISSDKNLTAKIAGNDSSTDHKNWSTDFVGWSDNSIASNGGSIDTPEGLVVAFFSQLAQHAVDRENGIIPLEPGTATPISEVYVTANGRDLKQLTQKFLLMSVAYSQGTDDYLDDASPDKGLLSSNTRDEDAPYTVLGHQWDEGFGYFGAARDYHAYTDEELASAGGRPDWQGMHDTNDDGSIDLYAELNFGASVNAAKRDVGATVPTDYTRDAFEAFLAGRQLIYTTDGELDAAALDELRGHAQAAVLAWEQAIAATVVHYINETIADTQALGANGYSFNDHAKHWSELKGFALGLQFNPRSQLADADFVELHLLIGDAPVLATATPQEQADYITDLLAARAIIEAAYSFDSDNVENW